MFTIAEAAKACGVSHMTMRRRVAGQAFPNAVQIDGQYGPEWRIPLADLLAAGFTPNAYAAPRIQVPAPKLGFETPESKLAVPDPRVAVLENEVARLGRVLDEERHRRELAEALAAERARHIDHLAVGLRAIEAAKPARTVPAVPPPVEVPARRRRWRRG